jgi:hypothetical protein
MKKTGNLSVIVRRAVLIGAIICHGLTARAGWSGAMNGTGFGWASVNVTSSTLKTNSVKTVNMTNPSAAMTNTTGYSVGAPLPAGSSPATVARIKGSAGYVWSANTAGSNGDKTDNSSVDKLINLTPSECAFLQMDSSAVVSPDGKSGVLTINTAATGGTAILLRGFEYSGPNPPQSIDDLETNQNSKLKWDVLLVGPFDLNTSNCNAVTIPFTIDTSVSNLYFVSDGEAKSLPLQIFCPSNVVVACGQPVVYPTVYYSGCGDAQVSFQPPANFPFPVGVTPVVVTVTDTFGNSTNCTFAVTVTDTVPPLVPNLPDLTYGVCSSSPSTPAIPPTPMTTDSCMGIIYGTTTNKFPITQPGTTVVTWTFNDGNGNIVTAKQNVTLTALNFQGFYSPIGGTNGSCSAPFVSINQGSKIPIKFDMSCGTTFITSGTPPQVLIQAYNNCTAGNTLVNVNAVYQNNWHYNWDTSGWAKGIYKVIVVLPDGTSHFVFVKLV